MTYACTEGEGRSVEAADDTESEFLEGSYGLFAKRFRKNPDQTRKFYEKKLRDMVYIFTWHKGTLTEDEKTFVDFLDGIDMEHQENVFDDYIRWRALRDGDELE